MFVEENFTSMMLIMTAIMVKLNANTEANAIAKVLSPMLVTNITTVSAIMHIMIIMNR